MNFFKVFLDVLFPKRCPICEELLQISEEMKICNRCRETLPYIGEPRCIKCSKPVESEIIEYCFDCSKQNHYYQTGWTLWLYNETVKKSIQRFKYFNKRSYGEIFAHELVALYEEEIKQAQIQLVIPVPLYRKKEKYRGYNQSHIVACNVAKLMNITYEANCLIRKVNTKAQKDLTDKQRAENLINAFEVTYNDKIRNKNILIIDDIYTTGSTINSCSKELMLAGANKVYFLTLAIGIGF